MSKLSDERKEKYKIYRGAVRYCERHEKEFKIKKFLKINRKKNATEFWKEVNKNRKEDKNVVEMIDGKRDKREIIKLWKEKFHKLGAKNEGELRVDNQEKIGLKEGEEEECTV